MLDLPDTYRLMLAEIMRTFVPDYEVLAYGSRVNGQAHATSDLDLVIRHPSCPEAVCEKLGALKEALSESNVPIHVDVLDWACLPHAFREEILHRHMILFSPASP